MYIYNSKVSAMSLFCTSNLRQFVMFDLPIKTAYKGDRPMAKVIITLHKVDI